MTYIYVQKTQGHTNIKHGVWFGLFRSHFVFVNLPFKSVYAGCRSAQMFLNHPRSLVSHCSQNTQGH